MLKKQKNHLFRWNAVSLENKVIELSKSIDTHWHKLPWTMELEWLKCIWKMNKLTTVRWKTVMNWYHKALFWYYHFLNVCVNVNFIMERFFEIIKIFNETGLPHFSKKNWSLSKLYNNVYKYWFSNKTENQIIILIQIKIKLPIRITKWK